MPAAAEITRRSAGTCGAISPSRDAMSCGLTARMIVSALLAASALETARTPYRSLEILGALRRAARSPARRQA